MDPKDIPFVIELQNGLKLESRPFLRIAKELGMTEDEVISKIQDFVKSGVIRRLGIAVKPEELGSTHNALIAWKVPDSQVESAGTFFASVREISHCYERECPEGWPYNIFTMVHAKSSSHLESLVSEIKERLNLDDFQILKTVRELKKTSMRYFLEDSHDLKS